MALEFSWLMAGLFVVFVASGTIKGTLGIGLPTSAVSLATLMVSPQTAVALVVFPILFANVWQIYRQGQLGRMIKSYWLYALCIWAALWVSAQYAGTLNANNVSLVMGLAIMAFVLISFASDIPPVPKHLDRPVQGVVGTAAGALGGIAGVWSPPVMLYLLSKNLEREEFVRVTGFLLGMGAFPLVAGYLTNGLMPGQLPLVSCLLVVPTLIGFAVGERLRKTLGGASFRRMILIFFFLMGLNMLRKGLMI